MDRVFIGVKNNIVDNTIIINDDDSSIVERIKNEFNYDYLVVCDNPQVIPGWDFDGNQAWGPKPYFSWVKNVELNEWVAPIEMPENIPHKYIWNEDTVSWDLAPMPEKPYNSWIFDNSLYFWKAPVDYPEFDPENPIYYQWNEDILNWQAL